MGKRKITHPVCLFQSVPSWYHDARGARYCEEGAALCRGLADPEKSVVTNTKNGRFVTLSRKNLLTFLLQIAVKRAVANKLAVIRRKDEVHKWTRSKTRSF